MMGPQEKEVFGYFEKFKTIAEVASLMGMDVKRVRPAVQRLVKNGYLEKQDTPGRSNHETRYKIRTDWTEAELKPKPRGAQATAKPKQPKIPKKKGRPLMQVLGVWI